MGYGLHAGNSALADTTMLTGMPFVVRINDSVLWRGSDGREAFVSFTPGEDIFICTDIHGKGQPNNAVPFTLEALKEIVSMAEEHAKTVSE